MPKKQKQPKTNPAISEADSENPAEDDVWRRLRRPFDGCDLEFVDRITGACTAYVRSVERERFLDAGFEGYVSKPFTREGLLNTMERVLDSETGVVTTYRDATKQDADTPSTAQESSTERPPARRAEPERVLVNGRVLRKLA